MDIAYACKTIRAWNDLLDPAATRRSVPGGLPEAVAELRRYLESARGDGRFIFELSVQESRLPSLEGLQSIMPFVLRAESMEAQTLQSRRRAMS